MEEEAQKYIPICTRKQIGEIFYAKAKDKINGVTATYANATDEYHKKKFEAMDLGVYCIDNNITGDMLVQVDGETLKILIELSEHMQEKICSKTAGVAPELLEKFRAFIEFEEIKSKMEKSKK